MRVRVHSSGRAQKAARASVSTVVRPLLAGRRRRERSPLYVHFTGTGAYMKLTREILATIQC